MAAVAAFIMSGQSRRWSLIETVSGTLTRLIINFQANIWLLPMWGFHPTIADALGITALFTVLSLVVGYTFRRIFNGIYVRYGK